MQQIEGDCTWQRLRFQLFKPTKRAEWMKALSSAWSEAEAVELLSHEAPTVRGYAAYQLVRQFPQSAPLLRSIFSDESPVRLAWVDYGETSPLSYVLATELCELALPSADKELLWALQNAPEAFRRKEVFACLRKRIPAQAASTAFSLLQSREDVEAICTLGFDPRSEYVPVVRRFAQGSSVQGRFAAAIALAAFTNDAAVQTAQSLITDPDPEVRVAARISAWRLGQASVSEVEKLLAATDGLERVAAEALIWFPSEKSLATIERYLVAHPDDERVMHSLFAQRPSPLFLRKMRQWATGIWRSSNRHDEVLHYLAEAKDSAAAPIFDDALRARKWSTIVLGTQGLAVIGPAGTPYIRNLEKLLNDNNAYIVVGAAEALLTLKARQSLPQLREAKAKIPKESWAERRLDEIISELERLP
ncbi:hypothetical protein [Polyangium mundeleinium]|uniref:HEAT repeat domain-containing protein n=1 Tax=Polyangium mundeleinium TaxID=2995306 RepID=A0ABT5EZ41_9BACT|nr:hypothetical protein [Polyangium mundeleinium]MDC0747109.1 hypothetical protein [Polyangium mundeleinium]